MKELLVFGLVMLMCLTVVSAAEGDTTETETVETTETGPLGLSGNAMAAIGAFFAIAIAGFASAKGLDIAGNAAAGVTGEDEKNFSSALIMDAMPQTQVIYGFIIAILITLGIMGGSMTVEQGWIAIAAGLAVGITGLSAISQGKVAAASIGATAKNPGIKGKVLIFIVMPEIAALFGFVVAIMFLIAGSIF